MADDGGGADALGELRLSRFKCLADGELTAAVDAVEAVMTYVFQPLLALTSFTESV